MAALVLAEVPNPYISAAVAGDELPLVRVNDYVVHRYAMRVVPLNVATSSIPDLYGSCRSVSLWILIGSKFTDHLQSS
jgi:hypothetical protein